jgi:23S rRNA (cytosine1962-C5)-methyltransferase
MEGPAPVPGGLVEVRRVDGAFLGVGLYHPHSLIAVRLVGTGPEAAGLEVIDQGFFEERLTRAQESRRKALGAAAASPPSAYRLCHAEADGLPGVVVDRYAEVLVVQIACLGMEQQKGALLDALWELLAPAAIVLRGDSLWREQEGLPEETSVARGKLPERGLVEILEHGLRLEIDPLEGQKTGWFLDQRDHRQAIRPFAKEARCLDLCCYQGGFALNALAAGAASVLAVDQSEDALGRARENAALNGLGSRLETQRADVMDLCGESAPPRSPGGEGGPYDLIVLDPPSFTRSRKAVPSAKKAYRRLNAAALSWLAPRGILATASCSHHIYEETFLQLIEQAAEDAGRGLRILYRGFQPPDHPVLLAMQETRYLKFFIFEVA